MTINEPILIFVKIQNLNIFHTKIKEKKAFRFFLFNQINFHNVS